MADRLDLPATPLPALHDAAAARPAAGVRPISVRRALLLSIALLTLYFVALEVMFPTKIEDEKYHWGAVLQFLSGTHRHPDYLPMPPTYHYLMVGVAKVFGPALVVLRATNYIVAICAMFAFAAIAKRMQPDHPGESLLHFTFCPLLFPLMPTTYTDNAATATLVLALLLHVRRQWAWSGLVLLLATALRQTNLVWAAFFGCWILLDLVRERPPPPAGAMFSMLAWRNWFGAYVRGALRRTWMHLAIAALAVGAVVARGRVIFGAQDDLNGPEFNPAQYVLLLFHVALWWGIVLWPVARDTVSRFLPRMLRPLILIGVLAVVLAIGRSYRNPHIWNDELLSFRSLPLVAMQHWVAARYVGALFLLTVVVVLARYTWAQPRRLELVLVWGFTVVLLAPLYFVHPRYYIFTFILLNLLHRYTPTQARRLTRLYVGFSLMLAALICLTANPDCGFW